MNRTITSTCSVPAGHLPKVVCHARQELQKLPTKRQILNIQVLNLGSKYVVLACIHEDVLTTNERSISILDVRCPTSQIGTQTVNTTCNSACIIIKYSFMFPWGRVQVHPVHPLNPSLLREPVVLQLRVLRVKERELTNLFFLCTCSEELRSCRLVCMGWLDCNGDNNNHGDKS